MISVDNLSIAFAATPLLEDVSFVVNDRDRIALVGRNGTGKSTLLKLLCRQLTPTTGRIAIPSDTVIGYLPQVLHVADDTTVRAEAAKAFAKITALAQRVNSLADELAQRTDYHSDEYMLLVERYTMANDRLQLLGIDSCEADIEKTLLGLGFRRTDLDRPTKEFSGGWRMRIELAKVLLQRPDLLLLDEPTNHLDIESIYWLEQFLAQSNASVIVVSHDRAFINNVTSRTLELSCRHVIDYKVKYNDYVILRRERREQQIRAYENQQKEMADAQEFINRFRYKPSKAVQVQQKIKQLQKMVPIEIDEIDTSALHLKFPPCLRSGDFPVICHDVTKTWTATYDSSGHLLAPDNTVFTNISLTIRRGEKVAFVGRNGEGKTTLVKCIMASATGADKDGHHPDFYSGIVKVGHNVQIGYFAQNQAQLLDEQLTVFQTIDNVARGEIRTKINNILGAFMFGGEEADKKVKVLSGGERTRLAMIRLLLEPVNLLILDEPTNHLDLMSKDVLKRAIQAFDGTAIIVSHDREFLDGLVDKVYEFGNQQVREFFGGIYEFLNSRHNAQLNQLNTYSTTPSTPQKNTADTTSTALKKAGDNALSPSDTTPETQTTDGDKTISYAERKEIMRAISRLQRQIQQSEARMEQYQARLTDLDTLFANPDNAANLDLVSEYTTIKQSLDNEEQSWLDLALNLDNQQRKLHNP